MIQNPHSAVLYGVDQNGNCYYWTLHLVTGFHISIFTTHFTFISSISISERYLFFYNGTSHCSDFIGVHIWGSSGILFPPNFSLCRVRSFRRKKCWSVIWFYDFMIFIPTPLSFGVFGFGNVIGVYDGGTIAVWAVCPLFAGDFDPVANFLTPAWPGTGTRSLLLLLLLLFLLLFLLL